MLKFEQVCPILPIFDKIWPNLKKFKKKLANLANLANLASSAWQALAGPGSAWQCLAGSGKGILEESRPD